MGPPPDRDGAARGGESPTPTDPLCPRCGYDLRGHTSEVVRCPECGGEWLRDAAAAQARYVAREARKRTLTAADRSLVLFILTVVVAAVGGWRWAGGIPLALIVTGWVLSVRRVARRSGSAPGWARALAAHHAWHGLGLGILAVGLWAGAVFLATVAAFWQEITPVWQRSLLLVFHVGCAAAAIFGGVRGGNWCVRRGQRAIERLYSDGGWAVVGARGNAPA